MKKITTGIFAAIALLTMSFTVAEQAGAFKDSTSNPEICLANQDAVMFTTSSQTYQRGVDECTTIPLDECATVTLADTDFPCEGESKICCAKLESGCPPNQHKIEEILCQE